MFKLQVSHNGGSVFYTIQRHVCVERARAEAIRRLTMGHNFNSVFRILYNGRALPIFSGGPYSMGNGGGGRV